MLKESRMIHGHGDLYPHPYNSLLKYTNLLKTKRLSHDATHKKSIDRLQLDKDQEVSFILTKMNLFIETMVFNF